MELYKEFVLVRGGNKWPGERRLLSAAARGSHWLQLLRQLQCDFTILATTLQ